MTQSNETQTNDSQTNGHFHCEDGSNPELSFIESGSEVSFRLVFDDTPEKNSYHIVIEDVSRAKEHLLATLRCDSSTNICTGSSTPKNFSKLKKKFGAAPWVGTLRSRHKKADCVGELHNDATYFAEYGLSEKLYCSFEALSTSSIRLEGSFEPRRRRAPSFFLIGEGFERTGTIAGCVNRAGKWTQVFELEVHPAGTPSSSLFDVEKLDDEENQLIADIPWLYQSEWIHGHQFIETQTTERRVDLTSVFGQFSKTPKNGSNYISDTKKGRKDSAKRRRKREKRNKNKRDLLLRAKTTKGKRIFSRRPDRFLEFDPAREPLHLTYGNCSDSGVMAPDGLGTLSCGSTGTVGGSTEKCFTLQPSDENASLTGTACREVFYFVDALIITMENAEPDTYTACLDGSPFVDTISVTDGALGRFGELRLVDDLKTSIDTTSVYKYYGAKDLAEVSTVTVSSTSDCSSPVLMTSLDEKEG